MQHLFEKGINPRFQFEDIRILQKKIPQKLHRTKIELNVNKEKLPFVQIAQKDMYKTNAIFIFYKIIDRWVFKSNKKSTFSRRLL